MQVISSGKNTQLHAFPSLATEFTYPHVQDSRCDLQLMPDLKLFAEINPLFGFEMLRKTNKTGVDTISRIRKVLVNDLTCGACSGKLRGEIALGTQDGTILFYNIKKSAYTEQRFKPEGKRQGVLQMAYSCCEEMLASIYDNHEINIFGLNTSVKTNHFQLDMNSTVIRFNPSKRFHMAVGSYLGTVTVLDIQSKKSIFKQIKAHQDSPCPDVCWSPKDDQQLITVGYDSSLNVYDVRQKLSIHQIKHSSPYSSVAISDCGIFCTTGSLSGDMCSYDLRSIRSTLNTRKGAHSGAINRVGFVSADTASTGDPSTSDVDMVRSSTVDSVSANLLGGGRRSMLYASKMSHSMAPASRRSSVCRESIGGIRNRPSMLAVTSGNQDENDAANSFNGFLSLCTRLPDPFKTGRDSLMDMEVRPARFDVSDSSIMSVSGSHNMSPVEIKPHRRSSLHTRAVSMILEDDRSSIESSPIRSFTGKPSMADNILKDQQHTNNVMSSTIGELSTEDATKPMTKIKVEADASVAALSRRMTAIELKNKENSQMILQRLEQMEENHEQRSQELMQRIQEVDVFFRMQWWYMEDTELATLRNGMADLQRSVAQLTRSDQFVEQFAALKQENAHLRALLRAQSSLTDDSSQ